MSDYLYLQKTNRKLYIGCNNPTKLQYIEVIDNYDNHLNPTNRLVSLLHFGKKDKEYAAIDYKIEKSGLTREQHYYRNEFYQDMRMKNQTFKKM